MALQAETRERRSEVSEIKIEKGIPIPEVGGPCIKYPFRQMEIGDSFVVPKGVRTSLSGNAIRQGIQIKTKSISSTHVRVWRIK